MDKSKIINLLERSYDCDTCLYEDGSCPFDSCDWTPSIKFIREIELTCAISKPIDGDDVVVSINALGEVRLQSRSDYDMNTEGANRILVIVSKEEFE